jgi:hypothetical protein
MVMGAVLFIITYLRYTISGQRERGRERDVCAASLQGRAGRKKKVEA